MVEQNKVQGPGKKPRWVTAKRSEPSEYEQLESIKLTVRKKSLVHPVRQNYYMTLPKRGYRDCSLLP